ncbi:hypothetical protein Syun_020931 [Stephania yunnanensis]|uniref:Uncharacterized protein n=1 Tax=Stephania yunnanensis TaxID=152371 RepID=A0AAP0IEQ3_9MAGN
MDFLREICIGAVIDLGNFMSSIVPFQNPWNIVFMNELEKREFFFFILGFNRKRENAFIRTKFYPPVAHDP